MKYIDYDYECLLKDFNRNKNTVTSLTIQIADIKTRLQNPFADDVRGDQEKLLAHCEAKLDEYKEYVALTNLGLDALPQAQHEILTVYYIDGSTVDEAIDFLGISRARFFAQKNEALEHFGNVVFPM